MFDYYTAIVALIFFSLGILSICVFENERLPQKEKKLYYLTCILIVCSASFEWLGIKLNGNPNIPPFLIKFVKCGDYIFTPMAGWVFILQIQIYKKTKIFLKWIIITNTVFQIISLFTNWMTIIDSSNIYSHGKLYFLYVGIYVTILISMILGFLFYGTQYKKQNRTSLIAIFLLIITGIAFQELSVNHIRTSYLSMTLGAILIYIHNTEFAQQLADQHILEQEKQIKVDALTGLLNRFAYAKEIDRLDKEKKLPDALTIFSIDVNELKKTNDTLGHSAGDELICGAADCLKKVFSHKGNIYRTGGDEFIVITSMNNKQAKQALIFLYKETNKWSGEKVKKLNLAAGSATASDYPNDTASELLIKADKEMYKSKEEYYKINGKEKRN